MSDGNKRGYGYFMWKPYIIKEILSEINYGDIINYVDIGFHVIKENSKNLKITSNLLVRRTNGFYHFNITLNLMKRQRIFHSHTEKIFKRRFTKLLQLLQ